MSGESIYEKEMAVRGVVPAINAVDTLLIKSSQTGGREYDPLTLGTGLALSGVAGSKVLGVSGFITGSGTIGTVPKFTGSSAIGDSLLMDSGSELKYERTGAVDMKVNCLDSHYYGYFLAGCSGRFIQLATYGPDFAGDFYSTGIHYASLARLTSTSDILIDTQDQAKTIKFATASTVRQIIDATGNVDLGGVTDFCRHEPDGTIVLNGAATGWKDVFFPQGIPKSTGAGNPTRVNWLGNIYGYSYSVNDGYDPDSQEFPHDGKQNSTATIHVHFVSRTSVNAVRTVKWQVEYAVQNIGTAFTATTTVSAEQSIPANTPVGQHYLLNIGTFTTQNIGSHMVMRVTRIASSGTEPAADPVLLGTHFHYEIDTPAGSRLITTK